MAQTWVVAQLGSRMHYAVPRLLHEGGMLGRFFTDICAVKGWPRLCRVVPPRWRSGSLTRLLGREPAGVPAHLIRAFTRFGWRYARRSQNARTSAERTAVYLWAGKTFCDLVLREGLNGAEGIYTFNSAGLEIMRHARRLGLRTVMEQTIAPAEIEQRLLAEERRHFSSWEDPAEGYGNRVPSGLQGETHELESTFAQYSDRERAEWAEADLIVCGSEFVWQGIGSCGGPVERCVVVPYGVDNRFTIPNQRRKDGPLRVLTVGAVGLRKGSPYVLEAARRLGNRAVFRIVGPVGVSQAAEKELRAHVEIMGPIPRTEIVKQYAWADVFLLPSICEGSATVTYEALSCGLPVICTPNTGSIVRDGEDGFIVPVRNAVAVADRLDELAKEPGRLLKMSQAAKERAKEFTVARYKDRLIATLKGPYGSCVRTAK